MWAGLPTLGPWVGGEINRTSPSRFCSAFTAGAKFQVGLSL